MHRLNNRLKKLEADITGEPFTVPVFPPFTLENMYRMMDSWGINRNRTGQIALITNSDGAKGILEYNPKMLDLVKEKLDMVAQEYLSNPQCHMPGRYIYLQ